MLGAVQGNVITFANRDGLVDNVIGRVKDEWVNNWRNEIIFDDEEGKSIPPEHVDAYGPTGFPARFFHISVRNLHKDTSARNCVAYLESCSILGKTPSKEINSRQPVQEPVELKWKGMKTQSVLIPPDTCRKFDAVFIYENAPHVVYVGVNTHLVDFSGYSEKLNGIGIYELNYAEYSDNFPPIRSTYILEVNQELSKTEFYRKRQ